MQKFFVFAVAISAVLATLTLALFLFVEETSNSLESVSFSFPKSESTIYYLPSTTHLLFFGDMMLGRNVEVLMNEYGEDYPFEKIQSLIDDYDFVHANLEGPIVKNHVQTLTGSVSFNFLDSIGALLARHGFDAVTLANNHTLDQGKTAFDYTHDVLDEAGVLYSGHSVEMGEEYVLKTTINDLPFSFASFNVTFPFNDEDAAVATVANLQAQSDDPIIVNVHWGTEYITTSNTTQQNLAHELVDAGADLIIGHHPHVVEESEEYKDVMIYYSLGNFIFDQYWSEETQKGLAVGIEIDPENPSPSAWAFTSYPLVSVKSQPEVIAD